MIEDISETEMYNRLNESIEKKHESKHWINTTRKGIRELEELKKAHNILYK